MTSTSAPGQTPSTPAELVVITAEGRGTATTSPSSDTTVAQMVAQRGATLRPIFGDLDQESDTAAAAAAESVGSGLGRWYHAMGEEDELESLADTLRARDDVEAAYVKPPAEPAVASLSPEAPPRDMLTRDTLTRDPARGTEAPAPGNYAARQGYLLPAPVGIDAPYAWGRPGGRGDGVKVIDCEWGWRLDHRDLAQHNLGLVGGTNDTDTDHGTAVMGEIGGDHNGFGVNGIAPNATLGASSVNGQGTAGAIVRAAQNLGAGDVLLIEMHRRGPAGTTPPPSQQGYIAMEWWPDDFAAVRFAVGRGIVVVEAAGNGWQDLDAPVYDVPAAGFPASWKNPFKAGNPSSGAVLVGAGSPPPGTHGRSTSPWNLPYVDRARCGFSNWGSRVDAQGWGWEVTTCGYGSLHDGGATQTYTDTFSGTSSASPIVLGAVAATQGVLKAAGMPLMSSERARQLLRSTGSPQQPAPDRPTSQRIGTRPDLRQLIPAALTQVVNVKVLHTYAVHTSQLAYAYLDGFGWRRIRPGSADGVTNVLAACIEAQLDGKTVQVEIDQSTLNYVLVG